MTQPLTGYLADPRKGLNALDPGDATSDAGLQNRSSWGGHVGGAQQAVDRYRSMGQAAANRSAYRADYGALDEDRANAGASRGEQMDALSLERSAALGQQPSRAEVLGRKMIGESLDAEQAAAASARGGSLGQAAAYRAAADQAGAFRQRGMSDIEATRAMEMEHARDAYMSGASGVRAGDYQGAGVDLGKTAQDIQNEQFQRGLNQQGQQFDESLAYNTDATQLQANLQAQNEADQRQSGNIQAGAHSSDFGFQKIATIAGSAAGGAGSAVAGLVAHGGPIYARADGGPVGVNGVPLTQDETNAIAAQNIRDSFANEGTQYDPTLGSIGDRATAAAKKKPSLGAVAGRILGGANAGFRSSAAPTMVPIAPIVMPRRAHGGPTAPRPYLVGEEGPELVLPKNDGYVMTAQQTAALLGAPPTRQQTEYLESRGLAHARALGGPMMMPMHQTGGLDGASISTLGGNALSNINAENDAIAGSMMGPVHANHLGPGVGAPGGRMAALSGYAREDGGPVEGEASTPKRTLEVYRVPAESHNGTVAPAGSGVQTAPTKVARVPAHDPSVPWSYAPVHGGTAMASTSKPSARAMGGPVSGLGRAAAMRRCA